MLRRLPDQVLAGHHRLGALIGFLLLFVLTFAILQAVAMQINKEKIDLGKLPEQIGRP
jgi:hypothetical protein